MWVAGCFLGNSARVADLSEEYAKEKVKWLVGVDLAGDEMQPLCEDFVMGFQRARRAGLHATAHAGESGPAGNVREAIDRLGAERIGHGYHVVRDEEVYSYARQKNMHFEVSPLLDCFSISM